MYIYANKPTNLLEHLDLVDGCGLVEELNLVEEFNGFLALVLVVEVAGAQVMSQTHQFAIVYFCCCC